MEWTIQDFGAVGEGLSAIAVFVTLGYLAIQVRHTRQELKNGMAQSRAEALRELFAMSMDENVNKAFVKAQSALSAPGLPFVSILVEKAGVTDEEATLLTQMQIAFWNYRLQTIPIVDQLNEIDRAQFDFAIRQIYGTPGVSAMFYEYIREKAHPGVVQYIDTVLAD